MKLQDYRNEETGEIKEFDVSGSDTIPQTVQEEGKTWVRVWGNVPTHIPLHMTAEYSNKVNRLFNRGHRSSPTGKRTLYGGGGVS